MYSALTYSKPLAGILALSSWLPLHNVLQEVMLHKPVTYSMLSSLQYTYFEG